MKHVPDPDPLLADVFAESETDGFRAILLATTLSKVRRRRRARIAGRTAVPLLVMAIGWFLAAEMRRVFTVDELGQGVASYALVHTEALGSDAIVRTRQIDADRLVQTMRFAAVVQTNPSVRFIDDAELLALAGPRPAVLVRLGPDSQALIFGDEAEADGSRVE